MGKPAVVDFFLCRDDASGLAVAKLAAALERSSEHPIASAITNFERDYVRGDWVSQTRPSMFGGLLMARMRLAAVRRAPLPVTGAYR